MKTGITIRGDKQLLRRLKELEPKIRKRVLTKAMRPAMKPLHAKAKANAPKDTGQLRLSIKLRANRRSRTRVGIHVASGQELFQGKQFYGAFQEFGWHVGKRDAKLRSRGKWVGIGGSEDTRRFVEGKHFLEDAYASGKDQAASTFTKLVANGIHQAARGA